MKPAAVTPRDVVRVNLLAALLIFALPSCSAWFAGHGQRSFDERTLSAVHAAIDADPSIAPEERPTIHAVYAAAPPSSVCGSDDPRDAPLRATYAPVCGDLRQFGWAKSLSVLALGLGVLAFVVAGLCALFAFLSREAQYRSFVVGVHTLRALSVANATLQAGLAVFLSFWMTALWFERFSVQLVLLVGILALVAVGGMVAAVFRAPPSTMPLDGTRIDPSRMPSLRARIDRIAGAAGAAPPDHVVAGIDDNFFVAEGRFDLGNEVVDGRILYVSLSLLRVLSVDEAEAVIAHEMAHFGGGDVEFSTKLQPARFRFGTFVESLTGNPLTYAIGRFLVSFQSLFALASRRTQRDREFAADRLAAGLVSPDAVARALVRIGAYAGFGGRIERELFEAERTHDTLDIADRVAQGFDRYVLSPELRADLVDAHVPHPFDTHPPLLERIAAVGSTLGPDDFVPVLAHRPDASVVDEIDGAAETEASMWRAYEARFQENHALVLAYRYLPATPEERAHVERYFPPMEFASRDRDDFVRVDATHLHCTEFTAPIPLGDIEHLERDKGMLGDKLKVKATGESWLTGTPSIPLGELRNVGADAMVEEIGRYWGRARAARQYAAQKAASG